MLRYVEMHVIFITFVFITIQLIYKQHIKLGQNRFMFWLMISVVIQKQNKGSGKPTLYSSLQGLSKSFVIY